MYYFNFPQVSVFLATKVHICPTCKIHSPHPKFPPSLNLLQHQLKVQNLISSKGLNLIINSGMGEALGVIDQGGGPQDAAGWDRLHEADRRAIFPVPGEI